ncbi:MAG: HD-GYP domain-containing protein [Bacillota bacterium]|nr:HD-GYP domain-containing protein [Bacillota bacterium]
MDEEGLRVALPACAILMLLTAVLCLLLLRARRVDRARLDVLMKVVSDDSGPPDLKRVAANVVEASGKIVSAPGHYVYWRTSMAADATLLALDSEALRARVGVSYSSIAELQDSGYLPPFTLHLRGRPPEAAVTSEGDLRFVDVSLGRDHSGLLRVGPFKNPVPPSTLRSLSLLGRCAGRVLDLASQVSILAGDLGDARVRAAVASATSIGGGQLAETLLGLVGRVSRAAAGVLISATEQEPRIAAAWGLSGEEARAVEDMLPSVIAARGAGDKPGGAGLREPDPNGGVRRLGLKPVLFPAGSQHLLAIWMRPPGALPEHLAEALGAVASRIGQAMGQERLLRQMSVTYVEALKAIVVAMDAADPYGAGHSARVARYSRAIAAQMGLPDPGTVELAGFLHDIGMAALDEAVLFKTGRYDHKEHEEMKGHVELGGALAEPVRDHDGLGALVRHHHERWDGWGYPDGLRGDSIPPGARVLAVADSFCAATSSRAYRPAAAFDATVKMLETGAGSQFDPAVIQAFLQWWVDKQRLAPVDKSLEPCWEMVLCPPSIAASCPAYGADIACWTVAGVKCSMHGASCETCIVRTEHLSRNARR